jgi:penicillin amidase
MSRTHLWLICLSATLGCSSSTSPISQLPQAGLIKNTALSAPVDLVRDEWGIPHIYGQTIPDVAFVQGYATAQDRLMQMDLFRHVASGTLAKLLGDIYPDSIDSDITYRTNHLRSTVEKAWTMLQASTAADDRTTVQAMGKFAAGVNAYVADLRAGKYSVPGTLQLIYSADDFEPWTEVDSLVLAAVQAFGLGYDSDSDIARSQLDLAEQTTFVGSNDPDLQARKGIASDFQILMPVDRTYIASTGWPGVGTNGSHAAQLPDPGLTKIVAADRLSVRIGNDHQIHPSIGSNNWVIAPRLTKNGHTLVSNDTHLYLQTPPVFYMAHLVSRGSESLDVMGEQFAGIPGVLLGMNEHVAWGATVSFMDITDVYDEKVVLCDDGKSPCVLFKGAKVALVPRVENIEVGSFGKVSRTVSVTLFDVPHHGPIIPRITAAHGVDTLNIGGSELSVRYTGHDPAPRMATAVMGLNSAKSVQEALAAINSGFVDTNQNWVIGDDQGNIGWTQYGRAPRRAATAAPWKVLPGDGSAEWGGDLDARYIPHAYNPPEGFIVTANNDPIGLTDKGDPFFGQPVVDGAPLYIGADYDLGTRAGRITTRIQNATSNGGKLSIDDMQSIQGDTVDEVAQQLQPTLLAAATALQQAIADPTTHPELAPYIAHASAQAQALVATVLPILKTWSFDTPSGVAEDQPTPSQIADSQAAAIGEVWMRQFAQRTLSDEITKLGVTPSAPAQFKLLVRLCTHPELVASGIDPMTGDPRLFDVVGTAEHESKQEMAAAALLDALDFIIGRLGADASKWRWGALHTIAIAPIAGLMALALPPASEPQYANGYPRPGAFGTVDPASETIDTATYTYTEGPAIRFVAELDPVNGPSARNVMPGGENESTESPHYGDEIDLWRKNRTFNLVFKESEVAASAKKESTSNKVDRVGRIHFVP